MSPVQLLSPDGTHREDDRYPLTPTAELCRDIYAWMARARRFDDEAFALQRQGELGLWLQCRGQEAAQVGSILALRDTDWVFPSYRDHAAALCRGITPTELLSQWRGCSASGWDPAEYRFAVYTLVLAAQLPHATGFAMGVQRDAADEMVLVYFGDGSSSEGDANESFNWSAATNAPVLFFCQNNQWAISTPASTQSRTPLHRRAAGFGLDAHVVDGNDALAVLAVTRAAAEAVRGGAGPALVEARTYRMGGHSTSDDPTRYRSAGELDAWERLDPLLRLRLLLDHNGWADASWYSALEEECADLAADARRSCLALEPPPFDTVFDHVLAGGSRALDEERAAYRAFAGG